jgi:hypothetical protein
MSGGTRGCIQYFMTRAVAWLIVLMGVSSRVVAEPGVTPVPPPITLRPGNGYWSVEPARWFVAARPEVGIVYFKPALAAGYGIPHWMWVGVDVNSITTLELFQVGAGVRAATPIFDLSYMVRDTCSFNKAFLAPATSYSHVSVYDMPGPNAHYTAAEGEAVAILPLPYSAIAVDFVSIQTFGVPRGMSLYEENYRVIVRSPVFFMLRVALLARVLSETALKVGVLSEYAFHTGREQGVLRIGPFGLLQLTDHLSFAAGATLTVSSPDRLGIPLGAYGVAGFRYQWASGERRPELPWRGVMVP